MLLSCGCPRWEYMTNDDEQRCKLRTQQRLQEISEQANDEDSRLEEQLEANSFMLMSCRDSHEEADIDEQTRKLVKKQKQCKAWEIKELAKVKKAYEENHGTWSEL